MDTNTAMIAIAGIVVNGFVIATLGRAWLARRQPPPAMRHDQLENIEMRIVQLQASVDDVAIEVERLAEGQRFAMKLLAERGESGGESAAQSVDQR
jgi:hypothetical protein